MALEKSSNSFQEQQSSFKTLKISGREPGDQEVFFVRYIGKDEDGKRVIGKPSVALIFTNVGIAEVKYLEAPVLTVTPNINYYTASWPIPDPTKYPNYLQTEIYESKTLSNFSETQLTDPAVTLKATSSSNSYQVPTTDLDLRYVRIRHVGADGAAISPLSNVVSTTPINPSEIDVTPPGEVTINSAGWVLVGTDEEIQISYTIPATDGGKRFLIFLTSGTTTKFLSKRPSGSSLSQIASITKGELIGLFGSEYPVSFTGLFKSIDAADNISNGVPFSIGSKTNNLAGVVPTATATALPNGFSISWSLPGFARTAKVYTSTVSGFTPNESLPPQYYGSGPYVENTATTSGFATVYYVVKFFGDTLTDISNFSIQGSVTPLNPDITDTTPPAPVQSVTGTGSPDQADPSGIRGKIVLSLTNASIPADFGGYSVKIVNDDNTWYQEFPSSTGLSTLVVNSGILVGQSYTISVATKDKINYQNYVAASNNPILVSDNRINSSVVTGLAVSATDSIATVSWTRPADSFVSSYRVRITSNSDTGFTNPLQTIFTDSTQTSFGGLTPSTSYRVRVETIYSNGGAISTNNATTTFTLNSSGSISDGNVPSTNPTITTANIKSLFKAFAVTFPPVSNPDAVTYEVYIKPTNSTGIVDPQYKVIEVNGTFAVIRTLADKETELSYGTNYFIAIRARDNDGVSTAAVTAVGPVQTAQVANADLAAEAVYANNIKAGEIDASKMVTDLLFTNKTINVGESTSLNRIRLDANVIPQNTPGYTNPTSAIKSRIFIGSGNYNNTSTPFYADDLGRFSLKDKLQFDGTNLQIDANGSFGGLVSAGPTGNTIKIGSDVNGASTYGIYLEATGDYIYNSGNLRLGNGKITFNGTLLNIQSQVDITGSSTVSGDLGVTGASSTIYAGASKSSGNRVVMNSGGLFGYSGANINFSFPNSTGQFSLGTGEISGWSVSSGTIEKQTGSTYAGISTGTNAFFAGGGSGGSGSPKFKVTQAGVLTAEGVQINGGTLDVGAAAPSGFHVNSDGNLTAGGVSLTGNITATSGKVGNVNIDSNGLYISDAVPPSPTSGNRIVFEPGGIYAVASGNSNSNPTFQLAKNGTGKIAGWTINSGNLTSPNSDIVLDGTNEKIVFGSPGEFALDHDTETVTSYVVTGYTNDSGAGDDLWFDRWYSTWTPTYSTVLTSTNSISLKRNTTSGAQPSVTISTAGTGFARIKNVSSGGKSSQILLNDGGILLESGVSGGLKINGLGNSPHYTYSGIANFTYAEIGVSILIKSDGTVTTGRAFYRSSAAESSITNPSHANWPSVGRVGDVIFSTSD